MVPRARHGGVVQVRAPKPKNQTKHQWQRAKAKGKGKTKGKGQKGRRAEGRKGRRASGKWQGQVEKGRWTRTPTHAVAQSAVADIDYKI